MRAPGLALGKASVSVQSSKRDGEEEAKWQEDHQAGETESPRGAKLTGWKVAEGGKQGSDWK